MLDMMCAFVEYQQRVSCLHWRLSKQVSVQVRGVITVQDRVPLTTKLQACSNTS